MKIKKLISFLESVAPPSYQESYDNAGLLVGNPENHIKGVLISLDSTEAIVEEAIAKKCNVIVAHHPIIFKGLKKLTGKTYIERVVIMAIKHDIAIYAIHTNLDNVFRNGVNAKIAERLGLTNTRILAPKSGLKKLSTYVPNGYSEMVRQSLFNAGAGDVSGFEHLSHASIGVGTENGGGASTEVKLEVLFQPALKGSVINALHAAHPNSKVPYEISHIDNTNSLVGSGIIGTVNKPLYEIPFLRKVAKLMDTPCIRYTRLRRKKVHTVAICGGAGSFLLPAALAQKADVFITGDYKYHEFFDADDKIVIADIGHYESEQYTIDLLFELITEKFSNFAAYCTEVDTNPVHYLC